MAEQLDHKAVMASLSAEERASLTAKSDARGLLHLAGHVGAIAVFAALILWRVPFWPLAMLPLGILLIFLFTLLHECVHETPFKARWLNAAVARIAGFIVFVPATWFTYFHMAHHRHTHDPDHDPELEGGKPDTWQAYLRHLSGLPTWRANLQVIWGNAFRPVTHAYIPERQRARVKQEGKLTLLACAVIAFLAFYFAVTDILWIWLVPLLLGQPFLRAYLLAEHGRCPHVANMLENTRTTFTNAIVRFIAWNMPYHAEHHAYPAVPFWRLPAFHGVVQAHLKTTERGYGRFHASYVRSFPD
jgi:fatty acid desaturase